MLSRAQVRIESRLFVGGATERGAERGNPEILTEAPAKLELSARPRCARNSKRVKRYLNCNANLDRPIPLADPRPAPGSADSPRPGDVKTETSGKNYGRTDGR